MSYIIGMILYPFRHKGLDPVEVEKEDDKLYITSHIFKPWDLSHLDPKIKNTTYVCEKCSAPIQITRLVNRGQIILFKNIDAMNLFFTTHKNDVDMTMKWLNCEDFYMIDILDDNSLSIDSLDF